MRWVSRVLLFVSLWPALASAATNALIKLPDFENLADKAVDSVVVTLDEPLLKMATQFLSTEEAKEEEAIKILKGLRGIYVRSYTFEDSFTYPKKDIESIRRQVTGSGWSQLMEVRSAKEQAHVGIYVSLDDAKRANGLVIIATEPREFTIVNIVGSIDLDQLKKIEGQLGIPKIETEAEKPKKPDTPAASKK